MAKKRNHSSDSSSSSSDDDEVQDTKKTSKATSSKIVVSSDSSSSSDDDDGEWNAKPKAKSKAKRGKAAKKVPAKSSKKKLKTSDSNESDSSDEENDGKSVKKRFEEKEEGEVDFSDDDDDIEEFNDGFDENLMGDEEDKRILSQMTEKEREQELFNRSEKRDVLRTRFEIERKLRLAKKQEMKKKASEKHVEKNTDTPAYSDSATRSVERRRNMEDKRKVKDAIKGLKAEREKRKEKLKQKLRATDVYSDSSDSDSNSDVKPSKKNTKKSSSSSDSSSSSSLSDEDSDNDAKVKFDSRKRDENDRKKDRSSDHDDKGDQFSFTIEHLNSIRLSRFKMEKWCHSPFFKETISGCFVRIGIGNSQVPTYIVGQIVDVVETPKIYPLGKTRTNKGIKLKHAKNPERVYRLEYISNSEFTTNEYEKWVTKMVADRCDFPTKDFVERKLVDIKKAINYSYSEADIEVIVAEKERFKNKPVNFAMKKTQLLKEKEYAEMNGDHDRAIELGKEIDRLEDEAKRREKLRTQNIAAISFINERNRMRNIKEAERAIAEAAKEAQANKDDPFTRRKCTPTMIHVFNKNKQNENQLASVNDDTHKGSPDLDTNDSKELLDSIAKNTSAHSNNSNKTVKPSDQVEDANDMFSVHNFDIKIDFESLDLNLASNNPSSMSNQNSSFSSGFLSGFSNGKSNGFSGARPNPMSNAGSSRRSLNLDEYKKKKGLI